MGLVDGLRIDYCDTEGTYFNELRDIISELENGGEYYWSFLWLDGVGYLDGPPYIVEMGKMARKMPNGYVLSWKEIHQIAEKSEQIIDGIIIGSKDLSKIRQYKTQKTHFLKRRTLFLT